MKIIITKDHLNYIISESTEMVESGSHQAKELKRLLEWAVKFLKCTITPTKNGVKLCPPSKIDARCRPTHLSDKAIYDVERDLAKWFNTTRQEIHLAYKSWRPLRKNTDDSVNESMYVRRRSDKVGSYLEDALDAIDPLDYEEEYEYVSEVIGAITDDVLSDDENIVFDSEEFHKVFNEVSSFLTKKLYGKIQDHYDKVRTDY